MPIPHTRTDPANRRTSVACRQNKGTAPLRPVDEPKAPDPVVWNKGQDAKSATINLASRGSATANPGGLLAETAADQDRQKGYHAPGRPWTHLVAILQEDRGSWKVAIARLPSGQHTADLDSCTIQRRAVAEQKTEFQGIFLSGWIASEGPTKAAQSIRNTSS